MVNSNPNFFIEKENFQRIVGDLIRKEREEKAKISQEELGIRTNYDRTYIGSIERGEKNASFYAIYKILTVLGVDPTDFISKI